MPLWVRLVLVGVILLSLVSDLWPVFTGDAGLERPYQLTLAAGYVPLLLIPYRPDVASLVMVQSMLLSFFADEPMRLAMSVLIVGAAVAATGRRLPAGLFAVAGVVWALVQLVLGKVTTGILWSFLPLLLVTMAGALGISELVRGRRQDAQQLQVLAAEKEEVRASERRRLATELHDVVAYDITVIAMQSRLARTATDPVQTSEILGTIEGAARQALTDLRRLVTVLRLEASGPEELEATNATSALRADLVTVEDHLEQLGHRVRIDVTGDLDAIPASLRNSIRRTLRESVVNVVKHSGTDAEVVIALTVDSTGVRFEAINSVAGPVADMPSGGHGLTALEERAKAFNGTCHHGTNDQGRFVVELHLPFAAAQ